MIKILIKTIAFKTGKLTYFYRKICRPNGFEYASFLKKRHFFYSIGDNCSIRPWTNITDPKYVKLGNNVQLTACTILGHDGSINMLNKAFNLKLDSVGKVIIHDNVFVGHGAIIMPGVSIGPNAIVAAGAVVTRDVAENTIVAGVPARKIGLLDGFVEKLKKRTGEYPWNYLSDYL